MLYYIQASRIKSETCNENCRTTQPIQRQSFVRPSPWMYQCHCRHNNNISLQERQRKHDAVTNFRLYGGLANPLEYTSDVVVATTSAQQSMNLDTSTIMIQPTFEPVLNVPAFTVFLFIMSIFVLLQWRIRAIDNAALQRNIALQQLRTIKALELSDPTLSNGTNNTVQSALQEYQRAYDRMEELRTVLPGVRIVSPPSSNINSKQQQDHEVAAQQFLGIIPLKEDDDDDANNRKTSKTMPNEQRLNEERTSSPLLPNMIRNVLLVLVALTQILLFLFLIGTDPMMPASLSSSISETTSSIL